MAATLYCSPSLDTSLLHAVEQIDWLRAEDALRPVLVLAPSAQAVRGLRGRLGDVMGVHLYQFYGLSQAVLRAAGQPVRWLNDTTLRRLIHSLLGQLDAEGLLSTWAAVREKPGLVQVLVDWLREMKSQGITAEDYAAFARQNGTERDRQLALLYARYQQFLIANNLSDADGLVWLAAERLEREPDVFHVPGLALAVGFDQFNLQQERMLRALAGRAARFGLYLAWDASRAEDSLALARLAHTRARLMTLMPGLAQVTLDEREPAAPALRHLRGSLFEPGAARSDAGNAVRAWTAPTREIEAREALREVKRLLLRGVPAGEIALLTPNPEAYRQTVELAAEEYGVPVSLETRLAANPAVQALSLLAGLVPDFPWRTTLEALRSPYIRQGWLTPEQVNTLERASRERPVVQGREQWLFALEPRRGGGADEPVEDEAASPAPAPREDELEAVRTGLLRFFEHLTPPIEASHREYTLWLQERILGLAEGGEDGGQPPVSLDLVGCAAEGEFAARDLPALGVFMQHLRALVDGCEVVFHGTSGLVTWQAYRADLLGMLQALTSPVNEGGVRFGRLEAAREQPVDYLLILGLSEGEFPAPPAPDPLYSPVERRLHPLPLRRRADGADASLFWLALSSCRRGLCLFRPRLDASGVPWQPSPFWDAVTKVLALQVNDLPIAHLPTLETAASPAELLAALKRGGARGAPAELAPAWQAAQRAAGVIGLRQGWAPAPVYEGRLQAADVTAEIAARYHARYNWSPSRLNRYGACPFGFFAQYVLDLESRPDPEEGMDAMRRGTLLHTLLEHVFRRAQEQKLDPLPENLSQFLDLLARVCGEVFPHAPRDLGFRPDALWRYEQQELRLLLRAELAWECEQDGAYRPLRQELRFGLPQSEAGPVGCTTGDGEVFYLHGVIDRVDEVVDGGGLRVLDYKSGSTPYSLRDIREGRALQAPLYALAAEYTLGRKAAESAYLLIPRRELSGKMSLPAGAAADEIVQIAVDQAGAFVRAVRAGQFSALPGKPGAGPAACSALCDFASLCRTDRRAIAKARGSAA